MYKERGQAAFFVMLGMVPLCLGLGLVVDVGMAYYTKIEAQSAAQMAALAAVQSAFTDIYNGGTYTCGSQGLGCESSPTACTAIPSTSNLYSACEYANSNGGFTYARISVDANVTSPPDPPVSGVNANYWVRVQITQPNPLTFGVFSGMPSMNVHATAIAAAVNMMPLSCVVTTDPSASGALSMTGNVSSTISGCGVDVNSSSSSGLSVTGNVTLSAAWIHVVGGYKQTGNVKLTPTPETGVPHFSDPLEGVAAPQVPSVCDYTNYSLSGNNANLVLSPGTYCGGIKLTGNYNVTFSPGIYYLVGGQGGSSLNLSGNITLTGTGVSFYNTFNNTYPFEPLDLTGNTPMTLSAPTSGPLEGILFFEDRNAPSGHPNTITGNTSMSLTGALYFPVNAVTITGNYPVNAQHFMLVARTVSMTGNGDLVLNPQTPSGPITPQINAALID